MQCVCEIHAPAHPVQCLESEYRILQGDTRQARERMQRLHDLVAAEPVTASQHPLGFKQNGRADKDILSVEQRKRFRELLRVVGRQIEEFVNVSMAAMSGFDP